MPNHDRVPRFPATRRYAAEGPVIDIMWVASANPTWVILKDGLAWAVRRSSRTGFGTPEEPKSAPSQST